MNRWLRCLLVWCCVLALPLQGARAAGMLACVEHLQARPGVAAEHVHTACPTHGAQAPDAAVSGPTEEAHPPGASCSACSICAGHAALAGPAWAWCPGELRRLSPLPAAAAPQPVFLTEAPERPPRTI